MSLEIPRISRGFKEWLVIFTGILLSVLFFIGIGVTIGNYYSTEDANLACDQRLQAQTRRYERNLHILERKMKRKQGPESLKLLRKLKGALRR